MHTGNVRLTKTEMSGPRLNAHKAFDWTSGLSNFLRNLLICAGLALVSACASSGRDNADAARLPVVTDPAPIVSGTMRPYQIRGRWYRPAEDTNYEEVGMASWYGSQHHGRSTASGERFDMNALTAAHKTLPLPGLVEVTNLANGRKVILRVNDRGPFSENRIIDLSRGAAEALDLLSRGVGEVRVRYVGRAPRLGGGTRLQQAESSHRRARDEDHDYWVQAGSFTDPVAARLTADRIGDRAQVKRADVDGQRYFRVLVGPWRDANAAEQGRQDVVSRGYRDALLISGG